MNRKINLSILDQSTVSKGATASEAFKQTIAIAKLADRLGFVRFWVSEHHNLAAIAGSAPEVLMVKLADETKRIRIGSGGIMLPNHSALKVAENFRVLEALFPGRIDLGMGRAPGGDRITSILLNPSNDHSEDSYLKQLDYLQHFFRDTAATQYGPILAVPQTETIPMQWILSSSGGSSRIAADYGMGLAVAKFINGDAQPGMVAAYKEFFKPSVQFPQPKAALAIIALCADTEEKAYQLRKILDYRFIQMEKGNFEALGDYESIKDYQFSSFEKERIQANAGRVVSGTKEAVKEALTKLADDFDIDEIIATTMTYNFEDRIRSFELLSEAFETTLSTTYTSA